MTLYGKYTDPYELEARGIERLSIVYGVVPVHADGSIFRESGAPNQFHDEYAGPGTLHKVAKGIVLKTDRAHETGLFRNVKVAWQPKALGKAAISRGVVRWPSTAQVFSADETLQAARDVAGTGTHGWFHYAEKGFADSMLLENEGSTDQIDHMVDQPLGNLMLASVLSRAAEIRGDQAFEISEQVSPLRS